MSVEAFSPSQLADLAAENAPQPLWLCRGDGVVVWANLAARTSSFEPTSNVAKQFPASGQCGTKNLGRQAGYELTAKRIERSGPASDEPLWLVAAESAVSTATTEQEQRDAVTGVLARAALDQRLADWVGPTGPDRFAVCFIDIDDFKSVNDRHGHPAADRALAEIADRLQKVLRTGDVVARYGGDEMVLLIAGIGGDTQWSAIEQRLQASLGVPHEFGETAEVIGCSVGVSFFDRAKPKPADQLLQEADRRMYERKNG